MTEQGKTMANPEIRLSTGSPSETNVDSNLSSIGGKMALTSSNGATAVISQTGFNNNAIWDDVTQLDNVDKQPDYRCLYIYNNPDGPRRGPMLGTRIYISGNSYVKFQCGKVDNKNREPAPTENEKTEPLGIAFEDHNKDKPLVIGTLNPGDYQAVWFKRTPAEASGVGEIKESFDLVLICSD